MKNQSIAAPASRSPAIIDLNIVGLRSDLAAAGAGGYSICDGHGIEAGGCFTYPSAQAEFCALEALRLGLEQALETCRAGDRLMVRSARGSQLPFLGVEARKDPKVRTTQAAASDLLLDLARGEIEVRFCRALPSDALEDLHREALRTLMG